jgi:hypothetical protein
MGRAQEGQQAKHTLKTTQSRATERTEWIVLV